MKTKIEIEEDTKLLLDLVRKEHHHLFDYNDIILYLLTLDGKYGKGSYYLPVASKVYLPAEERWIESKNQRNMSKTIQREGRSPTT